MRAGRLSSLLVGVVAACCAGCLTERQAALSNLQPRNRVFDALEALAALPEGKPAALAEVDRGGRQCVCVLQLAPDARLAKRYHARQDLTILVVQGEGVVAVEGTRYRVKPGCAVILPRLTAYEVVPTGKEELRALLVYTPTYDPLDVHMEK